MTNIQELNAQVITLAKVAELLGTTGDRIFSDDAPNTLYSLAKGDLEAAKFHLADFARALSANVDKSWNTWDYEAGRAEARRLLQTLQNVSTNS